MNSMEQKYEILNFTRSTVLTVIGRGGERTELGPTANRYSPDELIIKFSVSRVRLGCFGLLDKAITPVDERIMKVINSKIDSLRTGYRFDGETVTLEANVDVIDLLNASREGELHSELLGLTIYKGKPNMDARARNTMTDTTVRGMSSAFGGVGLGFSVILTDANLTLPHLYINILGKAKRVPVVNFNPADHAPDGLYITRCDHNSSPDTTSYTLDQLKDSKFLEGLGIFLSVEACESNGNTERCLQLDKTNKGLNKQLQETQEKLKKAEKDIEVLNKQLETAKDDHKYEVRSLKDDLKHSKYETKRASDKADLRLEQAKSKGELGSWTEAFKAVSNVLSGFMGLGRLFN